MNKRLVFLFLACVFCGFASRLHAQSAQISFQVNMKYYIANQLFNPTTESVDIAGTFNNWGSTRRNLSDVDGDSIYTTTLSGFTVSQAIEFKFRINGAWNGREEFPGQSNRRFTVGKAHDTVRVWYNDLRLPSGPPVAQFSVSKQETAVRQQVIFQNESDGIVDSYEWTFEGGLPQHSTDKNPLVWYNAPGLYDVQLIAKNNKGEADTLVFEEFISVIEREQSAPKWWNESVFYEIFVRSFYDSDGDGIGDFQGIIQKLDYLNDGDPNTDSDLGITGIWLMPIHPSPSYHGYDVTDYLGVHPDYGTMDDFKELLAKAHERGIKIIIDYVMNHSSSQHRWFQQALSGNQSYRDFYRWSATRPSYTGPWGQQVWHARNGSFNYGVFWSEMPDLNFDNVAVKDSIFNAASFWIDEIGIDGFRLDAVKYIFEEGNVLEDLPKTHQFFGEFSAHIKQNNPNVFTVGEAWTSTDKVLDYVLNDRIDYAFEFDVANGILNGINSGNAIELKRVISNAYSSYPYLQYGLFLTNHDINRVMNQLGNSVPKNKVAASLYLTLPGIPYIYYGEEIGMTGVKPDEYIRTPMQWNNQSAGGFTTGSPWIRVNTDFNAKNVALQQSDENSLLNHYKKLVHYRNTSRALKTGDFVIYPTEENAIFVFSRSTEFGNVDSTVIVASNMSNQTLQHVPFKPIGLEHLTQGIVVSNELSQAQIQLQLTEDGYFVLPEIKPYETLILKATGEVVKTEFQQKVHYFELKPAFPNPFNPSTQFLYTLSSSGTVEIAVFDTLGRKVKTLINENQTAGTHQLTLTMSEFASGMYVVKLTQGNRVAVQKVMLVK